MERLPENGVESTKEGGGPPDWKFYWNRTGENAITIIYGDVNFPYVFQNGRVIYKKRSDLQRVSRHLTDAEYNEVRRQAEKIFERYWEDDAPADEIVASSSPKKDPEQFELKFK